MFDINDLKGKDLDYKVRVISHVAYAAMTALDDILGVKPKIVPWSDLPSDVRIRLYSRVITHLANYPVTPEEAHDLWREGKTLSGYKLGPKRDPYRRINPFMVKYNELPDTVKLKAQVFSTIINQMRDLMGIVEEDFNPKEYEETIVEAPAKKEEEKVSTTKATPEPEENETPLPSSSKKKKK